MKRCLPIFFNLISHFCPPGIEWGTHLPEPVVNIDLAPTFLDLAGINPLPVHMDGRSIVPLLNKTKK